jgi:hypothetical protein
VFVDDVFVICVVLGCCCFGIFKNMFDDVYNLCLTMCYNLFWTMFTTLFDDVYNGLTIVTICLTIVTVVF